MSKERNFDDIRSMLTNFVDRVYLIFLTNASSFLSNFEMREVCSFDTFKRVWKDMNISQQVHTVKNQMKYHFNVAVDSRRTQYKEHLGQIFEWLNLSLFHLPNKDSFWNRFDRVIAERKLSISNSSVWLHANCKVCLNNKSEIFRCCASSELTSDRGTSMVSPTDDNKRLLHTVIGGLLRNICILFVMYCIFETQIIDSFRMKEERLYIRISAESFQLLKLSVEGYSNIFYFEQSQRETNAAKRILDKLLSTGAFQFVYSPVSMASSEISSSSLRSQGQHIMDLIGHHKRVLVIVKDICDQLSVGHEHKLSFPSILANVPALYYLSQKTDKDVDIKEEGKEKAGQVVEPPFDAKDSNANRSNGLNEDIMGMNIDEFFFGNSTSGNGNGKSAIQPRNSNHTAEEAEPPVDTSCTELTRLLAALEKQSQEILNGNSAENDDDDDDDDAWMRSVQAQEESTGEKTGKEATEEVELASILQAIEQQTSSLLASFASANGPTGSGAGSNGNSTKEEKTATRNEPSQQKKSSARSKKAAEKKVERVERPQRRKTADSKIDSKAKRLRGSSSIVIERPGEIDGREEGGEAAGALIGDDQVDVMALLNSLEQQTAAAMIQTASITAAGAGLQSGVGSGSGSGLGSAASSEVGTEDADKVLQLLQQLEQLSEQALNAHAAT